MKERESKRVSERVGERERWAQNCTTVTGNRDEERDTGAILVHILTLSSILTQPDNVSYRFKAVALCPRGEPRPRDVTPNLGLLEVTATGRAALSGASGTQQPRDKPPSIQIWPFCRRSGPIFPRI